MKTNKASRFAAAALAMAMCVPGTALAADEPANSGSFDTSFDVYSPKLTIQVPVNLDVKINPIANTTATDVNKYEVASQSIDIWNASVDTAADVAIPINVTVKASITDTAEDVITEYNTFTSDITSAVKKINLNLSQAGTDAVPAVKSGETAGFDSENKLDLSKWEVGTAAVYTTPVQSTAITKWGSLLSLDIAGPTTSDSTAGATFSTDATKVTPKAGSFAVTGVANAGADWKKDDVKVAVTYSVKASKARGITPKTLAAVDWTSGTSAADLVITVPGVGESTVLALGFHNDASYGDYLMEEGVNADGTPAEGKYKVEYVANAGATDAKITIAKDNAALEFLAGDGLKNKAQDLVIALSDGRYVVSTFTAK